MQIHKPIVNKTTNGKPCIFLGEWVNELTIEYSFVPYYKNIGCTDQLFETHEGMAWMIRGQWGK